MNDKEPCPTCGTPLSQRQARLAAIKLRLQKAAEESSGSRVRMLQAYEQLRQLSPGDDD